MKIYDCFTFFNELDLLEIRLNELNEVVDYFVLVEATTTHSRKPKELYFQKNKDRYKKFEKKIIHIITDLPQIKNNNRWVLENYQRNQIDRGLKECKDEDIILISDVDEIPNKEKIKELKTKINKQKQHTKIQKRIIQIGSSLNFPIDRINNIFRNFAGNFLKETYIFEQNMYYYYINNRIDSNWNGTVACTYKIYKEIFNCKPQNIRNMRNAIKNKIPNGGWHFSYLGSVDEIIYKIQSFAHKEYDNKKYLDKNHLKNKIENNKDLFNRNFIHMKICEIDETYPEYILKNKNKFKKYILKK